MEKTLSITKMYEELKEQKYSFSTPEMLDLPEGLDEAKALLWKDWDNLEVDGYLEKGRTFRRRRLGYYYWHPITEELLVLPKHTMFQSVDTNWYSGGMDRQYIPISQESMDNPFLQALIRFVLSQFPMSPETANKPWEINVHEVRVVGKVDETGEPTPEGIHNDGDDFTCNFFVQKKNVVGGVNGVYDLNKQPIEKATLNRQLECLWLHDPYVMHDVSAIYPKDPAEPAIRDMLLLGFISTPDLQRPE